MNLNSSEIFLSKISLMEIVKNFLKNRYAYIDGLLKGFGNYFVLIMCMESQNWTSCFLNKYLFFIIFSFYDISFTLCNIFLIGPFLTNFF